jgi:Peptidase inhibitor I9
MKFTTVTVIALTLYITGAEAVLRHHKLKEENKEAVPGQFIIELEPSYKATQKATGLVKALQQMQSSSAMKPELMYTYDGALNGFAVKNLPDAALAQLIDDPQVKAVWRVSERVSK